MLPNEACILTLNYQNLLPAKNVTDRERFLKHAIWQRLQGGLKSFKIGRTSILFLNERRPSKNRQRTLQLEYHRTQSCVPHSFCPKVANSVLGCP